MKQKGFAITGILYTLLLIAIVSLNLLLYNLLSRKNMLDQIKTDTVNAIEKDSDFEYLLEQINELKRNIITIDKVYPIGSIYITRSNVDPNTLFEGTKWEKYGVGRTLLGTDSTSDEIGGSDIATLKISNLPSHSHTISHTHTTMTSTISNSGSHTHNTTAKYISSGLTADTAGNHTHGGSQIGAFYVTRGNGTSEINGISSGTSFNQSNEMGGVTRITLTSKNGAHTHNVIGTIPSLSITSSGDHTHTVPTLTTNTISTTNSGNIGGGESFSIRDPYITVYMWKRVL